MHCLLWPPGGDSCIPRSCGSAGARASTNMDNSCRSSGRPVATDLDHTCAVETRLLQATASWSHTFRKFGEAQRWKWWLFVIMMDECFRVGTMIVFFCLILTLVWHGSKVHGLLCLSYSNLKYSHGYSTEHIAACSAGQYQCVQTVVMSQSSPILQLIATDDAGICVQVHENFIAWDMV
jgi:hypothetical protein